MSYRETPRTCVASVGLRNKMVASKSAARAVSFGLRNRVPEVFPLVVLNITFFLGLPSPFFPGILLSRKPSKTQGNSRFLKRTMVGKNGQGINP